MSFDRPWWLAGLLLLVPLVILHLRRPRAGLHDVPSLLLWDRFEAPAATTERRFRRPRYPILLALQALAVIALVLALSGPSRAGSAPAANRVFVLDDSVWMGVGQRLAQAEQAIAKMAGRSGGDHIVVVAAQGNPGVVYSGDSAGVAAGLASLAPSPSSPDLRPALAIGAGLLGGAGGRLVVVRSPEAAMPSAIASPGQLQQFVVGDPAADQGLFDPSARCGIGTATQCEIFATVANTSGRAVTDAYTATVAGRPALSRAIAVPAHSRAIIALTATPGARVTLRLRGRDALAADNAAYIDVPGAANAPPSSTVTLVGEPATALPLARAFAAIPGVTLELRTVATYRPSDAAKSVLVVVDGQLPRGGLPRSPAVLLVHPAALPDGAVHGALATAPVTGADQQSPILSGVDLSSLTVDANAATGYTLPVWMQPLVWSGANPLLAAGDNGSQREALLAFDVSHSDLPQLDALPILARNVLVWATQWAPSAVASGTPFTVAATPGSKQTSIGSSVPATALGTAPQAFTGLQPAATAVTQTGPASTRRDRLVANLESAPSAIPALPVDLSAWARVAAPSGRTALWPWLALLGALAIAAEWLYWRRLGT